MIKEDKKFITGDALPHCIEISMSEYDDNPEVVNSITMKLSRRQVENLVTQLKAKLIKSYQLHLDKL